MIFDLNLSDDDDDDVELQSPGQPAATPTKHVTPLGPPDELSTATPAERAAGDDCGEGAARAEPDVAHALLQLAAAAPVAEAAGPGGVPSHAAAADSAEEDNEPIASKKRRVLRQWDKLTIEYVPFNAKAPAARPYTNKRGAGREQSGAAVGLQDVEPSASPKRKTTASESTPLDRRTAAHAERRAWTPGERCEAKYRAQQVGSHNALWFAGVVERVSHGGKRCDVAFDDGDREEGVPLRYLRLPPPAADAEVDDDPHAESPARADEAPVNEPEAPPQRGDEGRDEGHGSTPANNLRQTMISLLARDLSRFGLSNDGCAAIVDAIECSRSRFRSVRFNLRQNNAAVAKAFARGAVPLESIADLSAFARERPQTASHVAASPVAEPQYRYRSGQFLPMVVEAQ